MISDAEFALLDAELWQVFAGEAEAIDPAAGADAALRDVARAPDAEDLQRIGRILSQAKLEAVGKESVGFLWKALGSGAAELGSAAFGAAKRLSPKPQGEADTSPPPSEEQ